MSKGATYGTGLETEHSQKHPQPRCRIGDPDAVLGRWAGLPARRDCIRVGRRARRRAGLSRGRRGCEGEEARATYRRRAWGWRPRPCRGRHVLRAGRGNACACLENRASPAGPPCVLVVTGPLRCAHAQNCSPRGPGSVSLCGWLRSGRPSYGPALDNVDASLPSLWNSS